MPDDSPEREKYSIDEMMESLKGPITSPTDQGELVTRADGTVALRVRKRKRRTNQPQKADDIQTRRIRIFQVGLVVGLLAITLLVIGGGIIYANSAPFRAKLLRNITVATGAQSEIQQFRMNPKTANAGVLQLEWPEGNALKSLQAVSLSAEVFPVSFFGESLAGEEVTSAQAQLTLRLPKAGASRRAVAQGKRVLPVRFNRYRIPQLGIALGASKAPDFAIGQTEATLTTTNVHGVPQLALYGGALNLTGFSPLRLDRALVLFHEEKTEIVGLRLLHESDDRGSMELAGNIFHYLPNKESKLSVKLDLFEMSGLLGPELSRLFSGRIDSIKSQESSYFSFRPAATADPHLNVNFGVALTSNLQLQGFPFLSGLALVLDDSWFQNPIFPSDCSGMIHRQQGVVSLRSLDFSNKGRIALKGDISMASGGELQGKIELGVADSMIIASRSERLRTLFGPPKNGYRWLSLTISGTAAAPTDNFQELLAGASEAQDIVPARSSTPEGSTFEELTRPR